jgi:hypothetical protein
MLPGKIKSSISPDLKSEIDRGAIDGRVETASALDLQLGSDTLGVDLTPSTVESYKAQIARGEPIDPIVVKRGSDGSDYIADGAHRFEAAKQLGITEIPIVRQKNNVVMAAKVEPPTVASLEVPLNMKVMKDFQDEVASRTPTDKPVAQKAETQVQQGAQYIVDDIDELQKATGIDVAPLDRQVAASLTGEVRRSTFQEFKDKMGRNFQDTLTYASRTIGREGADFVYDMLKGNKFKRDALDALRTPLQELEKLNKKVVGKSLTARRDAGARIGQALDDRANADQYLKTPQELELFDNYVKVFELILIFCLPIESLQVLHIGPI